MSSRSAEAAIKGYTYQFLHTILDILENDDYTINVIEGIEDLDIYSMDTSQLCQYKYHECKKFRNSLVGKPIGLMYNHFINNETEQYNYRLILYIPEEIPVLDKERLTDILNLKTSQEFIEKENIVHCSDSSKIDKFLEKFSCTKALEFSKLQDITVNKLVNVFSVSEEEARLNILPSALKHIMFMGTKSNIEDRKISTKDFKQLLNNNKQISDIAFYTRINGEDKAVKILRKRIASMGIKRNSCEHVFFLSNKSRNQLPDLILEIAKKFYYDGNKSDFIPATFIVNNMRDIKKSILRTMKDKNQVMLFNDGYEDYGFIEEVFNQDSMSTSAPNKGKVNQVNFNFRLISLDTYKSNKECIIFKNPVVFCVDDPEDDFITDFNKIYYLNPLGNESVLSVIGG